MYIYIYYIHIQSPVPKNTKFGPIFSAGLPGARALQTESSIQHSWEGSGLWIQGLGFRV